MKRGITILLLFFVLTCVSARDWNGEAQEGINSINPEEAGSLKSITDETLFVEALHDEGLITEGQHDELIKSLQEKANEWLDNVLDNLDPSNPGELKIFVDLQDIIGLENFWGVEYWDEETKKDATEKVHEAASKWLKERVDELDPNNPDFRPFLDLLMIQEVPDIEKKFDEESKAYKAEHLQKKMDEWLKQRADEITTLDDIEEMKAFQDAIFNDPAYNKFSEQARQYKENKLRARFATWLSRELKNPTIERNALVNLVNNFCPPFNQELCDNIAQDNIRAVQAELGNHKEGFWSRLWRGFKGIFVSTTPLELITPEERERNYDVNLDLTETDNPDWGYKENTWIGLLASRPDSHFYAQKHGCGDGILSDNEQCDISAGQTCSEGTLCTRLCTCRDPTAYARFIIEKTVPSSVVRTSVPACGNEIIDGEEECDFLARPQGCKEHMVCNVDCECESPFKYSEPDITPIPPDYSPEPRESKPVIIYGFNCGDGMIGLGEDCDPSSATKAACPLGEVCKNCKCIGTNIAGPITCGDGQIEPPEECDPGLVKDGCPPDHVCSTVTCTCKKKQFVIGDGVCDRPVGETCTSSDCDCDEGEYCEPGHARAHSGGCVAPKCGDGDCEPGERCTCGDCGCDHGVCEPGHSHAGDDGCLHVPVCGDGHCHTGLGEQCDDCDDDCGCGQGAVCDPHHHGADDRGCTLGESVCGDGHCDIHTGEHCGECSHDCGCDTGMTCDPEHNDADDTGCRPIVCGDGVCEGDESCHECGDCTCSGNQVCWPEEGGGDGCYTAVCGDGHCMVETGETCDSCSDCACPSGLYCNPPEGDPMGCSPEPPGPVCGNGICEETEYCYTCPDCACPDGFICDPAHPGAGCEPLY
ncbi:hypothetical protein GF342_01090 [Candidatus Woesearchaeota archaeon]|nr:hypothetical protein [Candidatus Woesearchaeota archaeon]